MTGNHVMIREGAGILTVPLELQRDFFQLLLHYYETNDNTEAKALLYENCIDGFHEV